MVTFTLEITKVLPGLKPPLPPAAMVAETDEATSITDLETFAANENKDLAAAEATSFAV